jgi:heterotetrameric sarcosine oxidase delta subunit
MRIHCPLCGDRDLREFYYYGSEDYLTQPEVGDLDTVDAHLHLRDNLAGEVRDLWYHQAGCGSWLRVTRDTVSHAIADVALLAGGGLGISAKMKPKASKMSEGGVE